MLNVAPQKERIPDHLRAMAEQDDKSAASGKTGEQSSVGVGCAPGEQDGAPAPRSHPPQHSQLTAFLSDRLKMVRYFALAARGGQPRPRSRDSPAAPSTALHVPACSPERHPRRAAGLS